jgi:DNA-binding transcriptional MerR regulator
MTDGPHLKVGELARRTGITVRTLHHWDEIGLLRPSDRTDGGHRAYAPQDVARLSRVLALRRLGLPLDEIAARLDADDEDPRDAVRRHLDRVREELVLQERLRERLTAVLAALDEQCAPSTDDLIDAIEVMTMVDKYYNEDQLEQLAQRRKALGEEGMRSAERDWAELLGELRAAQAAGTDPGHPHVQQLAARAQALIDGFTGGDPGIRASLQKMYENEDPQQVSRGMVDRELMTYLADAMGRPGP